MASAEPLAPGGAPSAPGGVGGPAPGAAHTAGDYVNQQAINSAVNAAGHVLGEGAREIRVFIVTNPRSVHVVSFIGGLILAVVSFLSLFDILGALPDPLHYVLNIYQCAFGLMICVIDGPPDRLPALREAVLKHASFLHNNGSRAFFYLFVGCLCGIQVWYLKVVGWCFVFIAAAHLLLHCWQLRRPHTSDAVAA
eukprot:TRINITY_DN24723_c0_g2_i1.p1 TRINITY_DN24723_c0_g2~~TRINITY_DN24723_c0_g2_i1.p1  ORF type:complete len:195 (+),score=41.86 TRINITY_DN24723_c0_g2_i1:65-649(+)